MEDIDLYEILGIQRGASKAEVKKAYHRAALSSHPDKVAEDDRAEAEVKFKAVGKAYEVLSNDDKRHLYDVHGMAAFAGPQGSGMGTSDDLDEMLANMFGMGGMGGMGSMGGGMPHGYPGGPGTRKPSKGDDEEQDYKVTLEELYKGKTTKFASKKSVVCSYCKGTGGKEKAKSKPCASCQGKGVKLGTRSIGPGLFTQEAVVCSSCKGTGSVFKEKDRCKKCKGERVVEARKVLELYIPRGSREGDRIVLEGEADQLPDQEAGDIVFNLVQTEHSLFQRAGADLSAHIQVTLAEALCGFSRTILKHLDGRGIYLKHPKETPCVLKPGQVIKVPGEGMPLKKSDQRGDLYLIVDVEFPNYKWLERNQAFSKLQEILPKPAQAIAAEEVDDVDYDEGATLDDFGGRDPQGGDAWEDEDDEETEIPCAQQ